MLAGKAIEAVFGELTRALSGVIAGAGKSKVEEILKDVLKKSREKNLAPEDLKGELGAELERRLADDSAAGAALRQEIAEVLDAVGAIRVAIESASEDIREDIARAFSDLAAQYEELKGLLTDMAAGLEQVMEAQSHQLALQMEQLELQRMTASKLSLLISTVEQPRTPAVVAAAGEHGDEHGDGNGAGAASPPIPSPYPGLLSFQADDADRFFGRDARVADLVTRLASQSLVAVLGPSGSGKSSVVRAGLLPRIGTRTVPGSATWPLPIVMAPGRRPLEQLAIRLGSRRPGRDGAAVYPGGTHALGNVEFLDSSSGEVVREIKIVEGRLDDVGTTLTFGPTTVAVGFLSGKTRIFDLESGDALHDLERVEGARYLTGLAYDERSGSMVGASFQGQIVGWQTSSSVALFGPTTVQENQSGALLAIGFVPDGTGLLVGDSGGGLRRLAWGVDAWRSQLCGAAGRNMTQAEWDRFLPDEPYRSTCPAFDPGP